MSCLQVQEVKEVVYNLSNRLNNVEELLEQVSNQQIAMNKLRRQFIPIVDPLFRTYAQLM
jgi:hypothetical protein